jgi:hypothetical protein
MLTQAAIVPKHLISKLKPQDWELKLSNSWKSHIGKKGVIPCREFLELCHKLPFYGSTFFPACKSIPPQGYFELRTDHLLIAVNTECVSVIDEDRHKLNWYGAYDVVEWECTPDSITIEYLQQPRQSESEPKQKKASSLFITPQAHLIDSLAARAIYLIEREERTKKGQVKVKHHNSHHIVPGRRSSIAPPGVAPPPVSEPVSLNPTASRISVRKSMGEQSAVSIEAASPPQRRPSSAEQQIDRRLSGSEAPSTVSVDMPGRIVPISEDPEEEAANYLQEMSKIRKGSVSKQ